MSTDSASFLLKSTAKYYGGQNKSETLLANYLKIKKRKLIKSTMDNHMNLLHKDSDILSELVRF